MSTSTRLADPSPAPGTSPGGAGRAFPALVRSEWTKLRSVPGWGIALVGGLVLTVALAVLAAGGSSQGPVGGQPPGGGESSALLDVQDQGHLVHRTLTGDGSITARVASQEASHEWAKAGVVLRPTTDRGSPYAALVVTPDHGVRLEWDYGEHEDGSDASTPRWLRLTRTGSTVTAEESADGRAWQAVGTVDLDGSPDEVEVGLFVGSPNRVEVERQFGSESIMEEPTLGGATFDEVAVRDADGRAVPGDGWSDHDASMMPGDGGSTRDGDTFAVTGSGDIGPIDNADDTVLLALLSVVVALVAVVAVSVLFVTSEHRRGMIRTTFAASPRRGQVLAAKAVVVGGAGFLVGLVAAAALVAFAQPAGAGESGSLSDPTVLRAVVGTGLLLALVALLGLGAGTIARRSGGAITVVVVLLLVPQIVAGALPLDAAKWLQRVTPAAGFAIQQTRERYDTAIGPWAGLAVLAIYTAVAMALGLARMQRRDA